MQDDAALVAGDEVLPDTAIVLVLSQGPQPRPAPDLTNMTLEEATAATAAVQLLVVEGEQLFSDTVEVGRTISQMPAIGEPVERGGTVTVQLSKGPDVVAFPDLTGQTYAQAADHARRCRASPSTACSAPPRAPSCRRRSAANRSRPARSFPRNTAVDLVFL